VDDDYTCIVTSLVKPMHGMVCMKSWASIVLVLFKLEYRDEGLGNHKVMIESILINGETSNLL